MTTRSLTSAPTFRPALRINRSLTAGAEKRLLESIARHTPRRITSDQLTILGFAAQLAAGVFYAVSRTHPLALLAVNACIALNWLGDSLDGTLARVRHQQRPRFGFYVDHITDLFGATALLAGLALSGFAHWPVALAMLLGFLLLSAESFLATHTLARFELSQYLFGPTELRILLIAANLAVLRNPCVQILHHRILLFDLGGSIGALGMFALVVALAIRHTARLFREEPLP
ncbi:MAG TPA: CDP-alcohol phosphatidyltransferase family protein [Candidatus Aquilonibacter sp.]|nr:CDP-alcohol phosphatidyltransferase family protein [Candidatus Aquilonibacter sp.]